MKRRIKSDDNNKNLTIICKILNKNKITYFPFYGTLLGLVREGSCIDGDDDIDIMVPYQEKEKIYNIMNGMGMKNTDGGNNFLQFTYRINKTPVIADFYFFEESEEYVIEKWNFFGKENNQKYNIHYDKKHIFPITTSTWNEVLIPYPANPEALVRYCYGEEWKNKKSKTTEYRHYIVDNKIVIKYFTDK